VSLSRELWHANADLAAEALAHPFVQGLADGSLPEGLFAGYVAQDAFFLEAFARGYALGVAHSPDRSGVEAFADLLQGVREELRLHGGYAARWAIDLAAVRPAEATLAYTDFLLATAAVGDVGLLCAALTPCMRLYAHLGGALAQGDAAGDAGRYREWVDTYAAADFAELAATLEQLLDRYAADTPSVRAAYRRAMRLEVGFFAAAWEARTFGTHAP
jgi:thiaminase/transcriptional activator TenA